METRKIQVVGNRSYSMSIPKQWITDNNLKNHDSIFVQRTENNQLIISAVKTEHRILKTISFHAEDATIIPQFLVFCYMKNIEKIRIHDKKLTLEAINAVRGILKYLEGYDITNETEKEIEIQFLFNEINITLPKIIRRMYYLMKLQVESLEKRDSEAVLETEMAIDRLYYLSTRVSFACIRDNAKRIENEIENEEDLFFINNITKRIESISDNMIKLRGVRLSKEDIIQLRELIDFVEFTISKKTEPKELKKIYEGIKVKSKDNDVNIVLNRILDLCRDILDAKLSLDFNKKIRDENKT